MIWRQAPCALGSLVESNTQTEAVMPHSLVALAFAVWDYFTDLAYDLKDYWFRYGPVAVLAFLFGYLL